MLQPEIARRLRDRKVANLEAVGADVIAAGNLGCMTQIGSGTDTPVVHTVELLDWAYGGPMPEDLADRYLCRAARLPWLRQSRCRVEARLAESFPFLCAFWKPSAIRVR